MSNQPQHFPEPRQVMETKLLGAHLVLRVRTPERMFWLCSCGFNKDSGIDWHLAYDDRPLPEEVFAFIHNIDGSLWQYSRQKPQCVHIQNHMHQKAKQAGFMSSLVYRLKATFF